MWIIALLLVGALALAKGSVPVEPECESTQQIDPSLVGNQWTIGAETVAPLNIRNTSAEAQTFAEEFRKIWNVYGLSIGTSEYHRALAVGQELITKIQNLWAQLQRSIEENSDKNTQSSRINNVLGKIDDQLELFLRLEPGNKFIESEFGPMPPQPVFKSYYRNLTATETFLRLAEFKDHNLASEMGYICSIFWTGWKNARKSLSLLQTQYRNQVLNNQVMPEYRKIVDNVYSCGIQSHVDGVTWARFVAARYNIVRLSDAYIKSLETADNC